MELMELLYRIMEELSKAGVPIIFKGAMILNLVLRENNPSHIERGTHDIDGDWIGKSPTMEQIEHALRSAVKRVDSSLEVASYRNFAPQRAAGFEILSPVDGNIANIDLSVRENPFAQSYLSYINGVTLTGATLTKMLSDKIYAVSDERICRRIKDLLDIYAMSYIAEFTTGELLTIWKQTGRTLGDFSGFREKVEELRLGYEKMQGVKNKPAFSELYFSLGELFSAFEGMEIDPNLRWEQGAWHDLTLENPEQDMEQEMGLSM